MQQRAQLFVGGEKQCCDTFLYLARSQLENKMASSTNQGPGKPLLTHLPSPLSLGLLGAAAAEAHLVMPASSFAPFMSNPQPSLSTGFLVSIQDRDLGLLLYQGLRKILAVLPPL